MTDTQTPTQTPEQTVRKVAIGTYEFAEHTTRTVTIADLQRQQQAIDGRQAALEKAMAHIQQQRQELATQIAAIQQAAQEETTVSADTPAPTAKGN